MTSTAVDLRALEAPEPLLHILAALEREPGPFTFLLAREPRPLYPMLRSGGWRHRVRLLAHGVELTVFRDAENP